MIWSNLVAGVGIERDRGGGRHAIRAAAHVGNDDLVAEPVHLGEVRSALAIATGYLWSVCRLYGGNGRELPVKDACGAPPPARRRATANSVSVQPAGTSQTSPGSSGRNRWRATLCLAESFEELRRGSSIGSLVSWNVPQWQPAANAALESMHAAHRLVGVLVLTLHEPARLVGADRQDGEAKAAMLSGHQPVVAAGMEAGVAGEIDIAGRCLDDEAGPERHAPVARAARRPMMRRLDVNGDGARKTSPAAPVVRANASCPGLRHG